MPDPSANVAWIALSLVPGLGHRLIARLIDHFGTLDAIFAADSAALRAVAGIGPVLADAICALDLAQTAHEIATWQAAGITLACASDPQSGYPAALAGLADAPPVLTLRGGVTPADLRAVALIGTRQPSPASRERAAAIARSFAAQGWTVISGLAAGIDTAAHQGALSAGGRTLAVLGCGVQNIYPPENAGLAAQIIQHGALLSELRPDAPPHSAALVARNRLITGLSCAIVVIESTISSGTRHAARFAGQQGRPVYALANGSAGNRELCAAQVAQPLPVDFEDWEQLSATW